MNSILPEIKPFIKGIENTPYAQEQAKKRQYGKTGEPGKSFPNNFDGKRYAVAGDVQIDVSGVSDDSEATIRKARQVRNVALVPSGPLVQNRRVAAMASYMEIETKMELAKKRAEEPEKGYDKTGKKKKMFDKVPTFQVRA